MELSRQQAVKEFRKMWKWISDETLKRRRIVYKEDYFKANNIVEIPMNKCYLCELAIPQTGCDGCPVEWEGRRCTELESEYWEWTVAISNRDYELASAKALKISCLKERK